jgi:hypothetical protein
MNELIYNIIIIILFLWISHDVFLRIESNRAELPPYPDFGYLGYKAYYHEGFWPSSTGMNIFYIYFKHDLTAAVQK